MAYLGAGVPIRLNGTVFTILGEVRKIENYWQIMLLRLLASQIKQRYSVETGMLSSMFQTHLQLTIIFSCLVMVLIPMTLRMMNGY
jgi:hypothetical protein